MKYTAPLIILMVLHTLFVMTSAYAITHLDSAMHFAGGITLGIFITGLITQAIGRGWCPDPGRLILFVLIICLVTTGAVCWEIYEWLSDRYIGTHFQVSLDDTVKDLVLGMAGAGVYAWLVFRARADDEQIESADGERETLRPGKQRSW